MCQLVRCVILVLEITLALFESAIKGYSYPLVIPADADDSKSESQS
jgi:hypothetical protein